MVRFLHGGGVLSKIWFWRIDSNESTPTAVSTFNYCWDTLRVVFTGDTKQIQSVEAGDSLRILEKESRLKTVSLEHVQRQTVRDYREAIEELRRNPERGFERLEAIGAVREVAYADRAKEVATAFRDAQSERKGLASVLVVCPTHEEINRVTDAIRSDRKTRGQLGASIDSTRQIGLNWTAAQKGDVRNFRAGQLPGFHRAVKGIAKNEMVEVARVEGKHLIVRNTAGTELKLTGKQARSFDVYESRSIEVSVGDRLLLTANRRDTEFRATNGELVTVAGIDDGRIRLGDGRMLAADYKQFSHGYAVTAHRSQGKSVDSVIISGDGMRKELFYVAASRGRQSVRVITSDKEGLRDTVARSTARKSASELARKAGVLIERGARRGLNAARELAQRCRCRREQTKFVRRIERQPVVVARQIKPERSMERGHERGISR